MSSRSQKILQQAFDFPLLSYLFISFLFRLPSLFIPYVDIDEVLWGLTANAIVDGQAPYHAVMGEKPPLLYLSYAAIFSVFGKHNYFAMHVFGIVWMALTAWLIFVLVKRIAHQKIAFFAGAAYLIFGSAAGFRMLATTGELLMNLFLVLSCLVFLSGFEKKKITQMFFAGALVMVAALFRQQSLIQIGAYVSFLAVMLFQARFSKEKCLESFKSVMALALGSSVVLALCLLYIYRAGSFGDFYLWVVKHNYFYIKSGFANGHVLRNFAVRVGLVLGTSLPLWLLVGRRAVNFFSSAPLPIPLPRGVRGKDRGQEGEGKREFEILIWFYLIVSLVATTPGGRFFPHYFLQVFPPLCILAALELFAPKLKPSRFLLKLTGVYVVLLLCKMPLTSFEMTINDKGDYTRSNQIVGQYIKQNTNAEDRIFIWGWAQGIYYYSGRDPAARFISTDFLTGRSPSQNDELALDTSANITPGSWQMLFSDFKEHKPTYILDTTPGNYHGYNIYPLKKFPEILDYVLKNYAFEKSLEGVDLYRLRSDPKIQSQEGMP